MTSTAITTRGLSKTFGAVRAVDGVDLSVPSGAVYGFLGPNGSGKTTTIRMLLGLIRPSAGEHTLLDRDFDRFGAGTLPLVGALVEGPAFYPYLSGRANLRRLDAADRTVSARTSRDRVATALERVGLDAAADRRYRGYSLGMKQRLGLASALLRPRRLLVLDEPTNGLDPQGTREVRSLLGELSRDGVTIFLSSHLLSEIEQLCTDVGVMSAGRLVWEGRLDALRAQRAPRVRVDTRDPAAARRVLVGLGAVDVTADDTGAAAALGDVQPERVVAALVAAGVGVRAFRVEQASLEELFVGLTGEGFDVSG